MKQPQANFVKQPEEVGVVVVVVVVVVVGKCEIPDKWNVDCNVSKLSL